MNKLLAFKHCVIGSGPAGLACAHELVKSGERDIIIIDKNSASGGLSRTIEHDGNLFDKGPHRFFTKNREISTIWHSTLGDDFIPVKRLTRIFYKNNFFNYPIDAVNALTRLGFTESFLALISYLHSSLFLKVEKAETFEDWIIANFGEKLYNVFFKIYTEKVWGIPCNEICRDWAAQRIKSLNMRTVISNAIGIGSKNKPKSLIDSFHYPVKGAGQMYCRMAENLRSMGVNFINNAEVTELRRKGAKLDKIIVSTEEGSLLEIESMNFFSSIPLTKCIKMVEPAFERETMGYADDLYFRDHISVNLLVDQDNLFPDQWIYIHSDEVKAARLANYNNFSPKMVKKSGTTALTLEYFVFKNDEIWSLSDSDLLELAAEELSRMRLVRKETILQGWIDRETECYPTYFIGYKEPTKILLDSIDSLENIVQLGRGGLYKYNNMDQSMCTGLLAARNSRADLKDNYALRNLETAGEYGDDFSELGIQGEKTLHRTGV